MYTTFCVSIPLSFHFCKREKTYLNHKRNRIKRYDCRWTNIIFQCWNVKIIQVCSLRFSWIKYSTPLKTSIGSINIFQGWASSPCYQPKSTSPASPSPQLNSSWAIAPPSFSTVLTALSITLTCRARGQKQVTLVGNQSFVKLLLN